MIPSIKVDPDRGAPIMKIGLNNLFFGLIYEWNLSLNLALYIIGDVIGAFALFFLIKFFFNVKFYFKKYLL